MSDASIPLFLNPVAGHGRAGRTRSALSKLLTENGIAYTVIESRGPGDLEEQVGQAAAAGAERVIVAGGDGSVHEAVNGIMLSGRPTALGVVPLGTGNDFAKACTIPLHWEDAANLLVDRLKSAVAARTIDVGRMNGRYFANGAGIGFDARVTGIARNIRLPIGDMVYLLAVLKGLWDGLTTPDIEVTCENLAISGPVTLVNISNGQWIGGMFRIAPQAANDDSELDLVVISPLSRIRVMRLLRKLMNGTHMDEPEMSWHRITACQIVSSEPVPSHLDGELQAPRTRFEVEVLVGALGLR
jgi:YegS/Rv2252/BmrU family lipid kinase